MENGKLDMAAISEAINRVFPPDQAATIIAIATQKHGGIPPAARPDAQPAQEGNMAVAASGFHQSGSPEGMTTFAKYFNADPDQVRNIVIEARQLRLAMGKAIAVPPGLPAESHPDTGVPANNATERVTVEKAIENAVESPVAVPDRSAVDHQVVLTPFKKPENGILSKPRALVEPVSEIDREIEQFAYMRTAYSSIDILDFIRYMKDKGYSFDESIILEKIYVRIEERKKEARSTIENEVEGIFNGAQVPAESDISRLIGRLREIGLVFEEEDVRRLARIAVLRRAQASL